MFVPFFSFPKPKLLEAASFFSGGANHVRLMDPPQMRHHRNLNAVEAQILPEGISFGIKVLVVHQVVGGCNENLAKKTTTSSADKKPACSTQAALRSASRRTSQSHGATCGADRPGITCVSPLDVGNPPTINFHIRH